MIRKVTLGVLLSGAFSLVSMSLALAQNITCPTAQLGDSSNLCADTEFVQRAMGNAISGLTGDVAAAGPGTVTATIQPGVVTGSKIASGTVTGGNIASNTVTNSNLANMAADTIKCNPAGSAAAPQDCPYLILQADQTVFVSNSGSDTTGNGTSGNPWKTWNHAIGVVTAWNFAGHTVTITSTSAQTFTGGVEIFAAWTGAGVLVLDGDGSTITDTAAPSDAFGAIDIDLTGEVAKIHVQNVTLTSTLGDDIIVGGAPAYVEIGENVVFGAAKDRHIYAWGEAYVIALNSYSITGNAAAHVYAENNAIFLNTAFSNITITGSPGLSIQNFYTASGYGAIYAFTAETTYSGFSGFTGSKYSANLFGLIDGVDGALTSVPGTAGTLADSGMAATNTGSTTLLTSAWTTFAPALSCGTATFNMNWARYKQLGHTTHIQLSFSVTTIGTCSGGVNVTLPNTPTNEALLLGVEDATTFELADCEVLGGTTGQCFHKSPWATGNNLTVTGTYENQ